MAETIKVLFASGSDDLIPSMIEEMDALFPELPLVIVSEFPPARGQWIPYHVNRGFWENFSRCRAALRGKYVRLAGVMFQPQMPYWRMRLIPMMLAPLNLLAFNEGLGNWMLRPRCIPTIVRHVLWRAGNFRRWQSNPGGHTYTLVWRILHPGAFRRPLVYLVARVAGSVTAVLKKFLPTRREVCNGEPHQTGISVVIPSRNGKHLLARLLPGLLEQLRNTPFEIVVVDNGSDDGTGAFLTREFPEVLLEHNVEPLSFARAVNRGIRAARYSHICLLNNDMAPARDFFARLLDAFERVPDLFCATAQIFFPEGVRRQETGKAVMPPLSSPPDLSFPIRCDLPLDGENLSYVLYGSGGCSLYASDKLKKLEGLGEIFEPAYVEDLDLGFRAWQRGWPTVFAARAHVVHEHRATTSRYYSTAELERVLEVNYLRFLARSIASPAVFSKLWKSAIDRLNRLAAQQHPPAFALAALKAARQAPRWVEGAPAHTPPEDLLLALASGAVAVFPGKKSSGRPCVVVVSPYLPFPLSHGGAVRMFNLMRRAASHFDQVLVSFVDQLAPIPPELLEICVEVVAVKRHGSHDLPSTSRPEVVEEFDSPALRAAIRQTVRKWNPGIAQLEFTQMAQYAGDCTPAKTILVEHDITFDLCQQMLKQKDDWDLERQLKRWLRFETRAWRSVDRVVAMSDRDRSMVKGAHAVTLPNGVDIERFHPTGVEPERGRLLFIGSFAHLPNLIAIEFFLREVWGLLAGLSPSLHIIAGARHEYHLERFEGRSNLDLNQPGIEVEGFVPDVRPAYERASVVIAPLLASAGTNIKILEAMAMGKGIVSTEAGINGIDLTPGGDVVVANTGPEFAAAIAELFENRQKRKCLENGARATVVRQFNWDEIAEIQRGFYEGLLTDNRDRERAVVRSQSLL